MITVDIILFCYNQEQYIEQAIQSIYTQELPNDVSARIIVADDASPDNTLAIIKHLAPESPFPITFLPEEPNMGISKNYKRSFAATSADYVAILEGDDYWLPNHINQHVTFLTQHPECSMVMSRITYMDVLAYSEEHLQPLGGWKYPSNPYLVDIQKQIVDGNQLGNLSACSFRGNHLRNLPVGLFEIPIADWMLGIIMAEQAPIALLADSSSVYRVKASGVWAGRSRWMQHKVMLSYADMYDRFQNRKYHSQWQQFKHSCWRDVFHNWMHYTPLWVQKWWHKHKMIIRLWLNRCYLIL